MLHLPYDILVMFYHKFTADTNTIPIISEDLSFHFRPAKNNTIQNDGQRHMIRAFMRKQKKSIDNTGI